MTIRLEINADTPQELIATINGLATLGSGRHTAPAPAVEQTDEQPESEIERPQAEAPKTRRRKSADNVTQDTAPSGAEQGSGDEASVGSGQTAAPAATSDKFGDQIKRANAEAAAERASEKTGEPVSLDGVSQVFAQATAQGTGKMSMMQAQALLKDNFVDVAGEPVRRIRDLQPKDYAAAIAKLEG